MNLTNPFGPSILECACPDKVLKELISGEHGFNTYISFNEISHIIVGAQDYYKLYIILYKNSFQN